MTFVYRVKNTERQSDACFAIAKSPGPAHIITSLEPPIEGLGNLNDCADQRAHWHVAKY